jgi:hypothetical protein
MFNFDEHHVRPLAEAVIRPPVFTAVRFGGFETVALTVCPGRSFSKMTLKEE